MYEVTCEANAVIVYTPAELVVNLNHALLLGVVHPDIVGSVAVVVALVVFTHTAVGLFKGTSNAPHIVSLTGAPVVDVFLDRLALNPLLVAEQSCLINTSYPVAGARPKIVYGEVALVTTVPPGPAVAPTPGTWPVGPYSSISLPDVVVQVTSTEVAVMFVKPILVGAGHETKVVKPALLELQTLVSAGPQIERTK